MILRHLQDSEQCSSLRRVATPLLRPHEPGIDRAGGDPASLLLDTAWLSGRVRRRGAGAGGLRPPLQDKRGRVTVENGKAEGTNSVEEWRP